MRRMNQSGTVAMELAFVLPLLLAILFFVFEFSWFVCNYILLADAAAVGSHVLAAERGYPKPYTDAQSAMLAIMKPLSGAPTIVASVGGVTCSSDQACQTALGTMATSPSPGTVAQISITYAFAPILNIDFWNLASMLPTQIKTSMAEAVQ